MAFAQLAKYLEKLEKTASRNDMTVILAELFGEATPEEARLIAYLAQGKLGPAYAAPNFAMADKMILKALGEEATELFKKTGDLGLTAEKLKSQIPNSKSQINSNIQITNVFAKLMAITTAGGEGSQEKKQQLVRDLLEQLDGVSAKYVVKVILGKLRTGFSDMTILDSLSWMITGSKKLRPQIEAMYNVRADLGEIARIVKSRRVEEFKSIKMEPKVGTPVLMAKAERAVDANEIWERNGRCAVEYKLDGLRIQAHVCTTSAPAGAPPPTAKTRASEKLGGGRGVVLFSRGLENVSSMYPDVVAGLQKQIKQDCIVEGEMIAQDKQGEFLPFQETVQRKRKYGIAEMAGKIPLTIFLFDTLVVGEKNIMSKPNNERWQALKGLVGEGKTVRLIDREIAESAGDIEKFFVKAIKAGTEGIVAKKLDGPYQAGARDFNWIKYKHSYDKSTLNDTIDAVVMGYDVGQGKRTAFGIGDFLIGVYSPQKEKYLTVAKVGTGLTDEEWKTLLVKLKAQATSPKPQEYEVSKTMECDFWVEPKYVVEIKADEITKSPMHTSGYALRFPRFIRWREKKPQDCTSDKEIMDMYNKSQKGGDK